jgi:trigger factor
LEALCKSREKPVSQEGVSSYSYRSKMSGKQMAQFGQIDPSEKDVNDIVARVLSNQDEVKRLSNQVLSEKILEFYKQKVTASSEEVTYQDFIKISYGE